MAKRTIVDTAALNLVINALRRDEAEGFLARGEMADILLKSATEYVEPTIQPRQQTFANPCGEIELSPPAPHLPDLYKQALIDDMARFIADREQDGKSGPMRDDIIRFFMARNWSKRYIKKILKENFKEYW